MEVTNRPRGVAERAMGKESVREFSETEKINTKISKATIKVK
jgi:hypothetical protein